jgi:AmmeMemoRadiSam system protein A
MKPHEGHRKPCWFGLFAADHPRSDQRRESDPDLPQPDHGSPVTPAGEDDLPDYLPDEQEIMLRLAHESLSATARGDRDPEPGLRGMPQRLLETRGCFVTLAASRALRGCIGHIFPRVPLFQAIIENTSRSAMRDPRFPSVRLDEIEAIQIEISILSGLVPLRFHTPDDLLLQLEPEEHGVVIQSGGRVATFLPQVWRQIQDRRQFMERLAEKAHCPRGAWKHPETTVSVYRVKTVHDPAFVKP